RGRAPLLREVPAGRRRQRLRRAAHARAVGAHPHAPAPGAAGGRARAAGLALRPGGRPRRGVAGRDLLHRAHGGGGGPGGRARRPRRLPPLRVPAGRRRGGRLMEELRGRVAVITGGASGIGRALADRFAAEGMRLVLADIEEPRLDAAVAELRDAGHEVIGVRTDVSDPASVEALADAAYEAFGAVHVLCNNAGVGPPSAKVWETTPNDWRWTFGVNVLGVAHGVIAFVPRMLAGGEEGVVVNTSSPAGPIAPMPRASVYAASKSAVTTLTECLAAQLAAEEGCRLRAAVFYPSGAGLLDTGLWTAERNRPPELARERPRPTPALTVAELRERAAAAGRELPVQPLDELADLVVEGIRDGRFVIMLPSPRTEETLRSRLEKVLRNENPTEVHDLAL